MNTQITLNVTEIIRYASLLINVFLFCLWLKSRIKPDEFLAGQWEGTLTPKCAPTDPNMACPHVSQCGYQFQCAHAIECNVMISDHKGRANTGYIHYARKDLSTGQIMVYGLDKLITYEKGWVLLWKGKLQAEFHRVYHQRFEQETTDRSAKRYNFEIQVKGFLFKPSIVVRVKHDDGLIWEGVWHKQ